MSLGSLSYLDLFVCVLICYIHISCIICKVKREKRKDISVSKQALHETSAMEEHLEPFCHQSSDVNAWNTAVFK